jgi:hypothetical protein
MVEVSECVQAVPGPGGKKRGAPARWRSGSSRSSLQKVTRAAREQGSGLPVERTRRWRSGAAAQVASWGRLRQ